MPYYVKLDDPLVRVREALARPLAGIAEIARIATAGPLLIPTEIKCFPFFEPKRFHHIKEALLLVGEEEGYGLARGVADVPGPIDPPSEDVVGSAHAGRPLDTLVDPEIGDVPPDVEFGVAAAPWPA